MQSSDTQSQAGLIPSFLAGLSSGLKQPNQRRAITLNDLKIQDKDGRIIPFRKNPVQEWLHPRLTGRDLIVKSRQPGVSTFIQALNFIEANTAPCRIGVVANDDETTQKMRDMQTLFYNQLPEDIRPRRTANNATRTYYPDTHSRIYSATAGNKMSGLGGTYNIIHGTEVAFWKDAASIVGGMMQGVPEDGRVVFESTTNGAQGWFYDTVQEILDGDSNWTLHFIPWWWTTEYRMPVTEPLIYTEEELLLVNKHNLTPEQIEWRRSKQRDLKHMFLQWYPEDIYTCFLTSVTGYFSSIAHYDQIFTAPTDATRQDGHEYVAGLDFAQTADFTALSVMDAETMQEVELLRVNLMPWGDIRNRIIEVCNRWGVSLLYAESNSIGAPNIEALREAAPNLRIVPFQTTAKSKPVLVNGLYAALDDGGLLLLPDAAGRQELGQFTASQTAAGNWQYEAANGGHDDTVIARMLAARAVYHRPGRILT